MPTKKNEEMLKFIIQASSNPDSIVMDCFCGSGTTLKAANDCDRQWIGIDKAKAAISITKRRFQETEYEYLEI